MSNAAFFIIAILMLASALAAACLRKLIHAALCLVLMFLGVSAFFFLLGAEVVGLVQIFVYVGAVEILIVFTILLTRRDADKDRGFNWAGVIVAFVVLVGLIAAVVYTPNLSLGATAIEPLTVKRIGETLMTDYIWPLQCVGV